MMSAVNLFTLALVGALIGVSQAQSLYGRFPRPVSTVPLPLPFCSDPFYPYYPPGADDLNALLLLAKATDTSNDVNSNDIINKLLNALIYTTTGAGGSSCTSSGGSTGSSCTSCSSTGGSTTKPNPPLIDLGLLTGDDLLSLMLAGQNVLDLDVGKGGGGGAVTNLLSGLL